MKDGDTVKLKDAVRTLLFKGNNQTYHQLYTKWGEELDPEHVLEEYPRPQLRRNEYTVLNGYWNYSITKDQEKPESFEGMIIVPFSPESVLSGVSRQLKPEEFLWYERSVTIEEKYNAKRCLLHFGAVDQFCEVFINQVKVAEHMGGYLPFTVDITERIVEGENLLTVKVTDSSETSYHSRGKQMLKRGGILYTAQSGIWQTVWLEWVPDNYIQDLKITPLVDQSSVNIEIIMNNKDINSSVQHYFIEIYENQTLIQSVTSSLPAITIPLRGFHYWSPENPFLYDLSIRANNDSVDSYFAMRRIDIRVDDAGIPRIFLNNEPYFQHGLLDQGYWPDGLYTSPSDEAMVFDISSAKELGFNMLRKHIKIEPLRWYYHCDHLGMLVWQDMVNGGDRYNQFLVAHYPTLFPNLANHLKDRHYGLLARKSEEGRKEWTKECILTVKLLYNCPSIAVWVPFNEGWGQFDAEKAFDLIRRLDNTRLIDHASGWFDQGLGDFKSIHNYFHKLKVKAEQRPVVFSEFGGYGCYIPEHSYSWKVFGYRIYLSKGDLKEAYEKLYQNEITKLIKMGLSATVYTQLSDVEDEVNGLFTYDRKVCKVDPLKLFSK
jgi:beta-galactosidase/beta-glucuronidase